jgi:hypothetical protein
VYFSAKRLRDALPEPGAHDADIEQTIEAAADAGSMR